MQFAFYLSVAAAVIATVFALQNMQSVTVVFLFWTFQGSLALVLLATLLIGIAAALLASLPARARKSWQGRSLRHEHGARERRLAEQDARIAELEAENARLKANLEARQASPDGSGRQGV